MFSKNNKKDNTTDSNASSGSSSGTNIIAQGTSVEGKINANNDLRIDGELIGTLHCKGRLIIGSSGKIDGEVSCNNAIIEGSFNGELKVSELLNVKETAKISGNIHTGKLLVQAGANFNVNCDMGGQTIKKKSSSTNGVMHSAKA